MSYCQDGFSAQLYKGRVHSLVKKFGLGGFIGHLVERDLLPVGLQISKVWDNEALRKILALQCKRYMKQTVMLVEYKLENSIERVNGIVQMIRPHVPFQVKIICTQVISERILIIILWCKPLHILYPHCFVQRVWLSEEPFHYWHHLHEQSRAIYKEVKHDYALSGFHVENYV